MKFSQNTPVISPNTIGNGQVQAVRDVMAYGTAGKGYDAAVGALGQMAKVAKEQQDDMDAADHMSRRNVIMSNITKRLYGENGILTTGVGENAKGLSDRVTQVVQEEFNNGMKGANERVRRSMAGTFNENMGNYQRIAAQQEGREYVKVKEADYVANQNINLDRAISGYADNESVNFAVNDGLKLLTYRAREQGWTNAQFEQEKRKLVGSFVGGAIQTAIDNSDLTQADSLLTTYGGQMDQATKMKYDVTLKKNSDIKMSRDKGAELLKMFGGDKKKARDFLFNVWGNETVTVGGGGSYFDDSSLNDEIISAAQKYNLDPALVAAVASAESNGTHSGANGITTSSVGALGVMQLMPDTAASLGVDPYDRAQNIEGGAKYLRQLLDTFGGDVKKAVAAYNAGPGAVKDYDGVPPYKETQKYVEKILGEGGIYSQYKKAGGGGNYDKGYNSIVGNKMDYGEVGCVEAVVKGGKAAGIPFFEKQSANNVVDCDTLKENAAAAGIAVEDFDANNPPRKGDVIIYDRGENQHAVTADGNGGYWGNSSSQGIVVHGSDYNEMGGKVPTQVIRTGSLGGGTGGHTKRKYSEAQLESMWRQYEAQLIDNQQAEAYEKKQKAQQYIEGLKGMSQSQVISYLEQIKDGEKYEVFESVKAAARNMGLFKESNSVTGTRGGSRGSSGGSQGNKYWYGASGKRYTATQKEEYERAIDVYNNDPNALKYQSQEYYDTAARAMNDIWATNYNQNVLLVAEEEYNNSKGDFYKTYSSLMEKYNMTQKEAADYVNYMLKMKSDNE